MFKINIYICTQLHSDFMIKDKCHTSEIQTGAVETTVTETPKQPPQADRGTGLTYLLKLVSHLECEHQEVLLSITISLIIYH